MTGFLTLLLLTAAVCSQSAGALATGDFTDRNIWKTTGSGWQPLDARTATMNYTGKWGGSLQTAAPVAPDSYYRVTFSYKLAPAEASGKTMIAMTSKGGNVPDSRSLWSGETGWNTGNYFFYSGTAERIALDWYPEGAPAQIEIRDISVTKLTSQELAGNLIPNADFNRGGATPDEWTRYGLWSKKDDPDFTALTMTNADDYIGGGKCAVIRPAAGNRKNDILISSIKVPIMPGRQYRFSAWLKGEGDDAVAQLRVDAWASAAGKHWYNNQVIRIDNQWKNYDFIVKIPAVEEYPDLARRTAALLIGPAKGIQTILYVKDASFTLIE